MRRKVYEKRHDADDLAGQMRFVDDVVNDILLCNTVTPLFLLLHVFQNLEKGIQLPPDLGVDSRKLLCIPQMTVSCFNGTSVRHLLSL